MKLKIDRHRWLKGEGGGDSYLLRSEDRKQCCLGFYLRACGMKAAEVEDVGAPHTLPLSVTLPERAAWLVQAPGEVSPDCGDLMETNDDDAPMRPVDRERRIAAIFRKHGVEVEFVG